MIPAGLQWGTPLAFLLLVPVLGLVFQRRLTGVNHLTVASLGSLDRRMTLRLLLAPAPDVLRLLGLVLLVVALARPRLTRIDTQVEADGLDIILAVDTSGSMRAEDFKIGIRPVDRLAMAKRVMADFVEGRPHDRIGVVVFGEEAFTYVPLTLDHESLLGILEDVEIGIAGAQGTAVGSALAIASKRLKDLEAPSRVVVLLTDGKNNAGRISPLQAAEAAKALGITVYTVGVGDHRRGVLGALGEGLDERGLEEVAQTTGGRFRARDADALEQVYETIDVLEPSPAEVRQLVSHTELFRWPLAPGVLLLALQQLLAGTWLRRSP